MNIKGLLKKVWDAMKIEDSPSNPSLEVRKKLEEKGYKFDYTFYPSMTGMYGYVAPNLHVTTPQGDVLNMFGKSEKQDQYRADYEAAKQEILAAKTAQNDVPPAPKP